MCVCVCVCVVRVAVLIASIFDIVFLAFRQHGAGVHGMSAYTTTGVVQRNPWHEIWCMSLRVMATAVAELGHRDGFLEDTIGFVLSRQHTITEALAW